MDLTTESAAMQCAVTLEAGLLAPMLQPLFADESTMGEYGRTLLAQALADRAGSRFASMLAARLGAVR